MLQVLGGTSPLFRNMSMTTLGVNSISLIKCTQCGMSSCRFLLYIHLHQDRYRITYPDYQWTTVLWASLPRSSHSLSCSASESWSSVISRLAERRMSLILPHVRPLYLHESPHDDLIKFERRVPLRELPRAPPKYPPHPRP